MGAVEALRPFLAPLFAWVSIVPAGAFLEPPVMVKLVVRFLKEQIGSKTLEVKCEDEDKRTQTTRVWTDAAAEADQAGIGGWEEVPGRELKDSRWFYIDINPNSAAWAFEKGRNKSSRFIAALELLGTLIAADLFTEGVDQLDRTTVIAKTDNQGNTYAARRHLTTKFPLCCVMMQMSVLAIERRLSWRVQWVPRERNDIADEISKREFGKFQQKNRILVDLQKYRVMQEMIVGGRELYQQVATQRAEWKRERELQDQEANLHKSAQRRRRPVMKHW
eukprot:1086039-Karenia_brevis.AAC.1